jgi:cellulose synthase/poly-beta-1,6-N-acetylglucosamine synthase-like glycosyltransferase
MLNGFNLGYNPRLEGKRMEPDQKLLRSLPTTPIQSSIFNRPARFQTTPHIAAIIPAYNEAGGIGRVLSILRQVELLTEIIVVDDGSADGTSMKLSAALDLRIRAISHIENRGKARRFSAAGVRRGAAARHTGCRPGWFET